MLVFVVVCFVKDYGNFSVVIKGECVFGCVVFDYCDC